MRFFVAVAVYQEPLVDLVLLAAKDLLAQAFQEHHLVHLFQFPTFQLEAAAHGRGAQSLHVLNWQRDVDHDRRVLHEINVPQAAESVNDRLAAKH